MAHIREVLANNLKEYRRRNSFSQDNLAELAGISSQYLATIETCRKFPTPEVLERLAAALHIESNELFTVAPKVPQEPIKLDWNTTVQLLAAIKQALVEEREEKKNADKD
jgi:transcriptional regulator with XRE-family HTH domain